jgi:H+/Cl- antiporter ClcA
MKRRLGGIIEPLLTAVVVGVIAGVGAAAFLHSLAWATRSRDHHHWLLWLLPAAGLAIGVTYHYGAGRALGGNNLVLNEIHAPNEHLPRRLAPLIVIAAVVTHLFGGSAGREGVALQVSAGLSDQLTRLRRRPPADRRGLLVIAIAAGFGAVFGTPVAGAIFALEVPTVGRLRGGRLLLPCLLSALVGDRVTRALGIVHDVNPTFPTFAITGRRGLQVAALAIGCGVVALAFMASVRVVKQAASHINWPPLRPVFGGLVIIAMVGLAHSRAYLGLSVSLGSIALAGTQVGASMFAWKLGFTAVTLGSGFQGGEVTPLFVIGATMAAAVGPHLGLPVGVAAAVGFVAVFAAASNTPLACTVLAVELFGGNILPSAAIACAVATLVSTRRSIYSAQRSSRDIAVSSTTGI